MIAAQSQLFNMVEVIHLPPYVPTEQEKRDVFTYADNVRRVMAAACNSIVHTRPDDPQRLELADWLFSRRRVPDEKKESPMWWQRRRRFHGEAASQV